MAYQTNSGEFFDYLNLLLAEDKVTETIQILSDATSPDPTLNGDLKFLKLRANKKLMVPAGNVGSGSKSQVKDVIKLISELKNAHARRRVMVNTLTEPSKAKMATIQKNNPIASPKKNRAVWPWVLLFLLLGGAGAGYFFKDKLLQNEYIQKVIPEGFLSSEEPAEINKVISTPVKKKEKVSKPKATSSNSNSSTSSSISSSNEVGEYYIQIASFSQLDQARSKRKRVEMSFDRAIILEKRMGGESNFKIVIPGFASKEDAEDFQEERKVNSLHNGAFIQPFSSSCRNLVESETNIYTCN